MSISLTIGRSYLPSPSISRSSFISEAASAIGDNPAVAADIALAATDHLLNRAPITDEGLRVAMHQLIRKALVARDSAHT